MLIDVYPQNRLIQIEQKNKILFSYAKEVANDIHILTQPAQCRDYLGDFLFAKKFGCSSQIYGMPINHKLELEERYLCLLLKISGKVKTTTMIRNLPLLHAYESKYGISLTELVLVEDKVVLVRADNFWKKTIFRLSLYTFLLKCLTYRCQDTIFNGVGKITDTYNEDWNHYIDVEKVINDIMARLPDIPIKSLCGYKEELRDDWYSIHNTTGFVSHTNLFRWDRSDKSIIATWMAENFK